MTNAENPIHLPEGVSSSPIVVAGSTELIVPVRSSERMSIEREIFDNINVSFMGSPSVGKSRAGKEFARMTGMNFIDTDKEVEKRVGMPVGDFIDLRGRAAFYKQQDEVLKDTLDLKGYVIGLGGAMVERDRPDNLGIMQMKSVTAYLRATIDTLTERTMNDETYRPGLSHDKVDNGDGTFSFVRRSPEQVRQEHMRRWNDRHDAWETAHVDVWTDKLSPSQVAAILKQKVFNHVVKTSRSFELFNGQTRTVDNSSR